MRSALLAVLLVAGSAATQGVAQAPYARFEEQGAGFLGPTGPAGSVAADTLRIGVVAPETGVAARALRAGATLAVADANARGAGPLLELHVRGDDGPWSSAAATAVRLVRDTGVAALIAGPDGGRAHACELVAAKLWIPVLAPAAADHTVDYANVPWTFRVGPDDRQQLAALLTAAQRRGWHRLAWIDADDRDSQVAAATAQRLAPRHGVVVAPADSLAAGVDAVLVWAGLDAARATVGRARRRHPGQPLLGPWPLLAAAPTDAAGHGEAALLVSVPEGGVPAAGFDARLPADLDDAAAWMAALTYDAVDLLARAAAAGGGAPAQLRSHLATARLAGQSGAIAFDGLGGRQGPALEVRVVGTAPPP